MFRGILCPGQGERKLLRQGIVRPGQVTPFRKASSDEVERRILWVLKRMRRGCVVKYELRLSIMKQFDVKWRQADYYIAAARQRLLAELRQTQDEHRINSLSFYQGIVADSSKEIIARLRAQENIDRLLGLALPVRMELKHSGVVKGAVAVVDVSTLDLPLEVRKKLLDAIRQSKHKVELKVLEAPSSDGNGKQEGQEGFSQNEAGAE